MRALGQADLRQQLARQRMRILFLCAADANRAKRDVVQRAHLREQMKLLEHHARFLADQTLVHFRIVDLQAVDDQIAAANLFQLVDTAQQRRFAGAGRPDNHYHLALLNLQVDIVQHLGGAKAL